MSDQEPQSPADVSPSTAPRVPSYFSHPDLHEPELRTFFEAAGLLWSAAPWTLADEDALLQVEIPAVELTANAVAILGARGDVKGVGLYRSVAEFRLEVAAASDDSTEATHDALYLLFDGADVVPASMREEVATHGWPLPQPDLYPVLGRLEGGKPAAIAAGDLRLMVALARAVAGLVRDKPEALQARAGDHLRLVLGDGVGPDIIITAPHPDLAHEARLLARAPTVEGALNPYRLPLSEAELRALTSGLLGFSLHRLLGLFCAVASVPERVEGPAWMALIVPGMDVSDEGEVKRLFGLLVRVYNHVIAGMTDGDEPALVPTASALEPCAEWARGFTLICNNPARYALEDDARQALFEIFAVSGNASVLEILADEGEPKLQARLSECREMLADNLVTLYDHWATARKSSARLLVPRGGPAPATAVSKPGRNDPCSCGSGKKYKKCCGR